MIILHTVKGRCNPDSANGVDKTIYYLCRAQAAAGHEVHLLSETNKEEIDIPGVKVFKTTPWSGLSRIPSEVKEYVDRIHPDICHFHSAYIPSNVRLAKYLGKKNIPYVVTPNGNCSKRLMRRRPWLKIPYKAIFERPYMNRAAFVHAVGDREAILEYGVQVPIVDAPNGIDPNTLPTELNTSSITDKYPDWSNRYVFVFIGRLDIEQKGLDRLLEAVAKSSDSIKSQIGILLVGPDWQGSRQRLEEQVEALHLNDVIKFFGASHGREKFELIASADCFIYPSRWEGMPFAVIEAMAAGQLCMVTPAADPSGVLASESAGLVVEESLDGIIQGLQRAVAMDQSERQKLIQKSRQVVENQFDWQGIAKKICDAYSQFSKS